VIKENWRTIYLLVGPKGSGKSYIGKLMEQLYHINFIRVEDKVRSIRHGRSIDDESYLREAFEVIEQNIREALAAHDRIVFESTGLTEYFDKMLVNLSTDNVIVTIRVDASDDVCLKRIQTRDQQIHINVSDDEVILINKRVREKAISTSFTIFNENLTREELREKLDAIIYRNRA